MERNSNSKSLLSEIPRSANRKGLVVFFIAVLIASFFWLLQSFDQSYQKTLYLPLSIKNLPEGLSLNKALPEHLEVRFESTGWDIMKFKRFQRNTKVVLNLADFSGQKSIESSRFLLSQLPETLSNVDLLLVSPDRLVIDFEKLKTKEVPIVADLEVSFSNQFGLSGKIQIEPGTVIISGPESEINKIREVKTEFRKYENLEAEVIDKIKLIDLGNKNIQFGQEQFDLSIPVEQLTEGTFYLLINLPREIGDTINLIPEKVSVKFQAAVSIFNTVTDLDFEPYVKIEDFNNATDYKIRVYCKVKQDYIYKVSLNPEYVDYILK